MNKKTFIENIRKMADKIEKNDYDMITLKTGYIFANKNYGEVVCEVSDGVYIKVNLYNADDDEKE